MNGTLWQDIDLANARPAHGTTINVEVTLKPTTHLALDLIENNRWLNVDTIGTANERLFRERVSRVKGTYTFTSKLFVRIIGQYVSTTANPRLYVSIVFRRDRVIHRLGALCLQAQLTVGDLRRLRR